MDSCSRTEREDDESFLELEKVAQGLSMTETEGSTENLRRLFEELRSSASSTEEFSSLPGSKSEPGT